MMLLFGLFAIVAGVVPVLDALGFIPGGDRRMNAPPWVVLTAGGLFVLVGVWLLLQAVIGEARAYGFGAFLGVAILLGLGAIVHWIAFGPGDRSDCSGGFSSAGGAWQGRASEIECRSAFGYGALLLDFLVLHGLAWWMTARTPGSRVARGFKKITEWGVGLCLLPLIALVVSLQWAQAGATKLAHRFKSGDPR